MEKKGRSPNPLASPSSPSSPSWARARMAQPWRPLSPPPPPAAQRANCAARAPPVGPLARLLRGPPRSPLARPATRAPAQHAGAAPPTVAQLARRGRSPTPRPPGLLASAPSKPSSRAQNCSPSRVHAVPPSAARSPVHLLQLLPPLCTHAELLAQQPSRSSRCRAPTEPLTSSRTAPPSPRDSAA
jgi:hypothetical protein